MQSKDITQTQRKQAKKKSKTNTNLQGIASHLPHNGDNRDHLQQGHNTHHRKTKAIQWAMAPR
jgi:mRNA-degrading endonuclease YafQ of YafQ-DinJ toxin-antitoxin module